MKDVRPLRILITAGPTRESLDPVRFLSNRSTGALGYCLAKAARNRGHQITLISGPTSLVAPRGVTCLLVESAREMLAAVARAFPHCDVLMMTAAVADYSPQRVSVKKIKRRQRPLTLRLAPTPDILAAMGRQRCHQILIGFALETEQVETRSRAKLRAKRLDLMVAHRLRAGESSPFGARPLSCLLIDRTGAVTRLRRISKPALARRLIGYAERLVLRRSS